MNIIPSISYVKMEPPYQIIKHGNKIGVWIATQMVTFISVNPPKNVTHNYPVVAKEDRITPDFDFTIPLSNSEGEVWDNVETRQVSVLSIAGKVLTWEEFIKILWHDYSRSSTLDNQHQKVFLFKKILKYNKSQMIPGPDYYSIHLQTELRGEVPHMVCSSKDDVLALRAMWDDDLSELEQRLVNDLISYLEILSPGRSLRGWRITYETDEERLRPLVDKLNANVKAKTFRDTMMTSFTIKALMPYEEKGITPNPPSPLPSSKTRGRVAAPPFEEYIKSDAPKGLIDVLDEMLKGKKGKAAYTVILAAEKYLISEPPCTSIVKRFSSVSPKSYESAKSRHLGINRFLNKATPISSDVIDNFKNEIEEKLKKKLEK